MSGKRVLWRDRSEERVRQRRRRHGRVLAAEGTADGFDLVSWLMVRPAGEATRPREASVLEP